VEGDELGQDEAGRWIDNDSPRISDLSTNHIFRYVGFPLSYAPWSLAANVKINSLNEKRALLFSEIHSKTQGSIVVCVYSENRFSPFNVITDFLVKVHTR